MKYDNTIGVPQRLRAATIRCTADCLLGVLTKAEYNGIHEKLALGRASELEAAPADAASEPAPAPALKAKIETEAESKESQSKGKPQEVTDLPSLAAAAGATLAC
jgi:hypothetical protein